MKYSCERRFTFEAAHRLPSHPGKCRHLHGHSYKVVVVLASEQLDPAGMVVELDGLDATIGAWIASHLDHGALVAPLDHALLAYCESEGSKLLRVAPEPTCEAIARLIFQKATELLAGAPASVTSVRVHETEDCLAQVGP